VLRWQRGRRKERWQQKNNKKQQFCPTPDGTKRSTIQWVVHLDRAHFRVLCLSQSQLGMKVQPLHVQEACLCAAAARPQCCVVAFADHVRVRGQSQVRCLQEV
jgi:hypothetical protein